MSDPILYWNAALLEVNLRDHTPMPVPTPAAGAPLPAAPPRKRVDTRGPTGSSWAFALVHLAMYDAVVAVNNAKAPYTGITYAGPSTSTARDAAVAAAGQCVLQALWPEYEDYLTAHATAQPMPAGAGLDHGHRVGVEIAETLLDMRKNDGADRQMHYASSPAYGRHRVDPVNPTQPFLGPQWGEVRHFVLPAGHVHLDEPPGYSLPDYLTDAGYKADHDEVRDVGALASAARTPDQTLAGIFWAYDGTARLGTPPRFYNQILRTMADELANTPEENAELFALANVAMGEAGIEAWHWKYYYNLWRPVIGIREVCTSNGPSGVPGVNSTPDCDPFWLPLGAPNSNQTAKPDFTPPFPAYPSGHATFGAALFQTVRLFYGGSAITVADVLSTTPPAETAMKLAGLELDIVSDELDGTATSSQGHVRTRHVRRFTNLATMVRENSLSRLYLGVHWRFDGLPRNATDKIGGVPLGLEVAEKVYAKGLVP